MIQFLSININEYLSRTAEHLQPRMDPNRLANPKVIYSIMPIGDILQIDECLATPIWICLIILDGCTEILVQVLHVIGNVVGVWDVEEIFIALKERLEVGV